MITNPSSGTNVDEIAAGIYRINTPVDIPGGPAVQLQPVPDRGRRAAAVPHRSAADVSAGREAVGKIVPLASAALRRLLAFRGG